MRSSELSFCGRALLGACALLLTGARARAAADDLTPESAEAIVAASAPWFESFEDWIRSGAGADALGPAIEWSAPPAEDDEWIQRDTSLLVIRSYDVAPGPIAAVDWRTRFIRGRVLPSELDVRTKVLGARAIDGGGVALDVRIEVDGVRQFGLPPVWQSVARAEVRLAPQGERWRSRSIALVSFERSQIDSPMLIERTAGMFEKAPAAAATLGVGMDRWATRLDDPGLTAWFGHQGLAVGDVNGDGLEDLYVAMPSGIPNMLLVQQPDGRVLDVAAQWGAAWLDDTKGVLILDMDGDGDEDLVSALGHAIVVQENAGDETLSVKGWCAAPDEASFYSLAAADLDRDGAPEIYGTRYVTTSYADAVPVPFEDARNGPSNHLFAFVNGKYEDVTEKWGLDAGGGRFSLAASFVDVDGDRDLDLYVVNDFGSNQLFERRGSRFFDATEESGLADPGAGMGASWADYDLDGKIDLHVTNMYSAAGRRIAYRESFAEGRPPETVDAIRSLTAGNSLFRGLGDGKFKRMTDARIEMGRWGWGGMFCDLDCDGLPDIVVPAGFLTGPEPGDL